jgi:hypothetical protein
MSRMVFKSIPSFFGWLQQVVARRLTLLIVLPLRFFTLRYSIHVSSDYVRVNLLRNVRVSYTDCWYSGIHQGFT